MRRLSGNRVTFNGTTYEIVEIKNINAKNNELNVLAEDPRGNQVILRYFSERDFPEEVSTNGQLTEQEVSTGGSTSELIVRLDPLDKGYIFNLDEVSEKD